jgi:hypothetical protein
VITRRGGVLVLLLLIQYGAVYSQTPGRIPQAIRVSREGRLPLPDVERQFLLSDLAVNAQREVFPVPPCLNGRYYVGLQLLYDLGDGNTTQDWTANLEIDFRQGSNTLWTRPLQVAMGSQTFVTTVFHDTLVSCEGNYRISIKTKTVSPQAPQGNIYLKVLLFKHLEEVFNPATPLALQVVYADNHARIGWNHPGTATAGYDLEWVFIEAHAPFSGTTAAAAFAFREPVRISTVQRYYTHPLFYPRGRVWYRARAVGYNPAYPNHRIPGQWFYAADAGTGINNAQADKNWQRQTTFTENGQYKHGISYLDGSLRARQQLTNLSSEKRTLVGESLYDYEGRLSGELMAVPAPDSLLGFRAGFHPFLSQDATIAGLTGPLRKKFHYDNRGRPNSTLSAAVGVGQYYSAQNPFTGSLHRDYIPQAYGYGYSQTEYLNDGTGRVRRQGGVGSRFRVDSDSTVRNYYGSAVSEELISLFGSNVGLASHYQKNLVVDANGQVSVTYLDQEGRTIATALAGEKPDNLQALPSYSSAIPAARTVNAGAKNQIRDGVSTTTHTLLNSSPNTLYTFDYDLSASASNLAQMGCVNCIFDLKITITDPEGRLMNLSSVAGNQSADGYSFERRQLTAASCTARPPLNHSTFSLLLRDIGDYTLVKTLTPRELSFTELSNLVQNSIQVQQQIQQIRNTYVIRPENCSICTEACPEAAAVIESVIGEVAVRNCDNLYQEIVAYFRQRYGQTGETPYEVPLDSIQRHPTYCQYELCRKDQDGDVFDKQLARIDSWEAAVSLGYTQLLDRDPFFNNSSLSGSGHKASAQARLNDVVVTTLPYDANGDGIVDGSLAESRTYRGSLDQVTDPANTAFYVDENGKPSTQGKHLLYLDLMGRRNQLSPADYQTQLSGQRWNLYQSFYLEAKRQTKLSIPAYQQCAPARAGLALTDSLPQTPAGIAAFGDAKGATGPVSNATLEMSIAVIENQCNQKLSAADSTAVAAHLRTYFNGKPENYFRQILSEDLSGNASLSAIGTILQSYGCGLAPVAVANPIACARDTTLYLPKPMFVLPTVPPTVTPPPSSGTVTPLPPATLQQQYDALWAFYNATGGANWTNRTGWSSANPNVLQSVSGWDGLTVNSAGFVTSLNMSNNNLNGSLPASIRQLTHLLYINISQNPNLSGPIPAEIGGMINLRELSLDDNSLSGPIPSTLGQLSNLTYLTLFSNLLSGAIPTELGLLTRLTTLYLMNNSLTGSIPASLGNLRELQYLGLHYNQLSGSVPAAIGEIASLQDIGLQANKLTGPLPVGLSAISALGRIYATDNRFTFEDLLYTIQNKPATTQFFYAFQDSVDVGQRLGAPIGGILTLKASVDRSTSPASHYQWFKVVNGVTTTLTPSPSATAYAYTTPVLSASDVGTRYYYKITHPDVPGLTLVSRMRTLIPFDGMIVRNCLAYNQSNPTLLKLSWVPPLSQAVALCLANAAREDSILTELAIQKLVETRASVVYNSYRTQCLGNVGESLQYGYASREHHYTLYYYDQAGNLVQTVPPAGVKPLSEAQVADFMAGNRTDPPHVLKSQYQYNSLNALLAQKTPDGGESRFYYNNKGQLRLSQNAEQSKVKEGKQAYSYTRYDEQGRTIEVGELATAQALTTTPQALSILKDSLSSLTFPLPDKGDYQLSDRTLTFYDFAKPSFQGIFAQQFLRRRVSWSAVLEKGRTDTLATYYSYDVHGNVRSLLQAVPGLAHKRTDYRYDLVSGKVNYVFYQYGKADELTHRYAYDADNRLTNVYTSSDGFLWNKEARYQYYLHGPLARLELGEYRVQAQDYFYTLQGWIKGVNMPYGGDPGRDGMNGSKVGKDAFAYTLGYYPGDYQPLNGSLSASLPDQRDQLWSRLQGTLGYGGLYNGNIAWVVTDLPKLGQLANDRRKGMQGMLYGYDQLNRIVQMSIPEADENLQHPMRI